MCYPPCSGSCTSDVATQPLQAPGAEIATQPLQAPSAGTATQPPQAPGAGPEVLPTGYDATQLDQSLSGGRSAEIAGESESEAEMDGEPASPASANTLGELPEDSTDQDLSEEANYRETIRGSDPSWAGIRSLTSTVPLPPWMIIHLPVPESNQPVKCLSSYRWMSGCVKNLRD